MKARRQLRRVLTALALLDLGVLVMVIGLALAWQRYGWSTLEFLSLLLAGVVGVLIARVLIGARLQRRSGDLY